jgi:hypothetical protein
LRLRTPGLDLGLQSLSRMADTRPDNLVGEIIQQRYAVLERTGADRYKVFDMKELCQRELLRWDEQWLPLPTAPATPKPPPVPRDARPAAPRRRLSTNRFEAAWFAHGEEVETGDADAEVTDYHAYQAHLEAEAAQMDVRPVAVGSSLAGKEDRPVLLFALPELA